MSALNWTVRGAFPSSVSESAQASSGDPRSSSSSPVFAPAAVVGGVAAVGAGAAGAGGAAVVAVIGLGVSPVGVPPPPQPARASATSMPSVAEQPSIRIVSPPGPGVGKRPRILTDTPQPVNVRGPVAWCAALLLLGLATAAHGVTTRGDLPVLVTLAAFPDRPLAHDRAYFETLIARLVDYYTEVSSGRLRIVPHIGGPVVTLPKPRALYVGRPAALAHDAALAFAAAATDPEDLRALQEAQGLITFFAGSGRESHVEGGDLGDPWSNYTGLEPPLNNMHDACVIAEEEVPPFSVFGVLSHEFGHFLGLPELYAPGGATHEGIGVWGLMGQGTWLGRGDRPPHLDAWSKARLGWIDVETIDRTTTGVTLPAVTRAPRAIRIPITPGNSNEYYLLENRMREGAD